jgi:predicted porin
MKKSLLALAVAAALPAFAQAQTNIVLNGSIDAALEYVDPDVAGVDSDVRVTQGIWSGSRLAVVGTEELGGGLKGIFNIEHRLAPDTGTVTSGATFWAGQSWVGLQGGFGAVRLGRQYTPIFRALAPGDVTGYSWYNNSVGLAGTQIRFNNDLSYQSPSLAGFTIHAAYAPGEQPGDDALGDTLGIAGVGQFGPVNFGLGWHKIDAGDTPGASDTDEVAISAGAKFGIFGFGLAHAQTEVLDNKRKAYFASLSTGIGAGTLYLVYKMEDNYDYINELDNDGIALTYSHGLSKRTFAYASVGYNKVDTVGGGEAKPKTLALGMRHFF